MARPKKATVDYFPHDTCHGSTMQILESKWGNDGYAFWFKLLEHLGNHDGHYIDCRKPAEWEFLTAKTHLCDETAAAILDMLAKLDAIDPFLWTKHKVIFCLKFLTRIEDAYRKRKDSLPTIEKVYSALNINFEEFPAEETPLNRVNDAGSTERERERERENIKPTTTRAQEQLSDAVLENKERLKILFPNIDLPVATEKLLNHYRASPVLLDPYLTALNWFQKEFPQTGASNGHRHSASPKTVGAKKGFFKANPAGTDFLS